MRAGTIASHARRTVSHRSRIRLRRATSPPRTSTTLVREVWPLTIEALPPNVSSMRSVTARLARPASGGADTRTLIASPCRPVISVRDAPGTTCTRSVAPSGWSEIGFTTPTYPIVTGICLNNVCGSSTLRSRNDGDAPLVGPWYQRSGGGERPEPRISGHHPRATGRIRHRRL